MSDMWTVHLTLAEYCAAVRVGLARFEQSSALGHNAASTYVRTYRKRLDEETVGACGELAFCKAMGQVWAESVGTFHHVADVGANIEVRTTWRPDGKLIVRLNDDVARWYVLVTGEPPVMTVRGCIRGSDARRDEWWSDPHGHRGSWFVPQSALRPTPVNSGTRS